MGQYHHVVNLDKREFLYSHKAGSGFKAWEQVANSQTTPALMFYLMLCPTPRGGGDFEESPYMGRWHGDRVVIVGDYAEIGDFDSPVDPDLIWTLCGESEAEVREMCAEFLAEDDIYGRHDLARRALEALDNGGMFTDITEEAVRDYAKGHGYLTVMKSAQYGMISVVEEQDLEDAKARGLIPA